jgi:hypothetical protein
MSGIIKASNLDCSTITFFLLFKASMKRDLISSDSASVLKEIGLQYYFRFYFNYFYLDL